MRCSTTAAAAAATYPVEKELLGIERHCVARVLVQFCLVNHYMAMQLLVGHVCDAK
jgi:hypothetical protein